MLRDRLLAAVPLCLAGLIALTVDGWVGKAVFGLLCLVLALKACGEFFDLAALAGARGYGALTAVFGCLYLLAAAAGPSPSWGEGARVLVLGSFLCLCFLAVLRTGPVRRLSLAPVWLSLGGFLYLFWSTSFLVRLYFLFPDGGGRLLLLYVVLITKMADTGAYVVGTLTARRPGGNRKLVPSISPGKSWEGLAGGVAAGVLSSVIFVLLAGDGSGVLGLGTGLLMGLLAPFVGLLGDLAESALKRAAGAKDSGRMGGLGGSLDVLDSLIPMAPLFYAFVALRLAL
ncbi:MAG: phosphatidate cytidylyltransferase [Lentisphaeria bacterium]|nr:phosphatidate cytidylyltransferase [Lentisphaeria bacterium]